MSVADPQSAPAPRGEILSECECGVAGVVEREPGAERIAVSRRTGNTLRPALRPIACWKVDELCFDFDGCFVKPGARYAFEQLAELRRAHPRAPMALFGHADPVGDESYNKELSEKRAKAIHGALVRRPAIWRDVHGARALQQKLARAGSDPGPVDGILGPRTEAACIAYMDRLCGELRLEDGDFLAAGECAVQGCGEFNPLRVFSQELAQRLDDPELRQERNRAHWPNRRVVALLFKPGTSVDPESWPCPTASEGVEGCRARFWSDADDRLGCGETGRERRLPRTPPSNGASHEGDGILPMNVGDHPEACHRFQRATDTFACRFYERLARSSPCENVFDRIFIEIDLPVSEGGEVDYRIEIGAHVREGRTRDGWLEAWVPKLASSYTVAWRPAGEDASDEDGYPHALEVPIGWSDAGEAGFGVDIGAGAGAPEDG